MTERNYWKTIKEHFWMFTKVHLNKQQDWGNNILWTDKTMGEMFAHNLKQTFTESNYHITTNKSHQRSITVAKGWWFGLILAP